MGLIQRVLAPAQPQVSKPQPEALTKEELELLLRTLGNIDIKGRDVEVFYNLIIKLQNQYMVYTT